MSLSLAPPILARDCGWLWLAAGATLALARALVLTLAVAGLATGAADLVGAFRVDGMGFCLI
jgi:multisubunit Na+/H+ antiporter MnhC subunit